MPSPLPGDPARLLVAGDTHGNWLHWTRVLLPAAPKHHVGGIIQLGDFGYWPITGEGRDYLAWLSAELDDDDLTVIFVDGSHEDHKALRQLPTRPDSFVEVTDRILWAPRGRRSTWQAYASSLWAVPTPSTGNTESSTLGAGGGSRRK